MAKDTVHTVTPSIGRHDRKSDHEVTYCITPTDRWHHSAIALRVAEVVVTRLVKKIRVSAYQHVVPHDGCVGRDLVASEDDIVRHDPEASDCGWVQPEALLLAAEVELHVEDVLGGQRLAAEGLDFSENQRLGPFSFILNHHLIKVFVML